MNSKTEQPVTVLQDSNNWLSVMGNLATTDVIVLVTPVVNYAENSQIGTIDPFVDFWKALQTHHRKVRHIRYTEFGIESVHIGIIQRAKVLVFVISESPRSEDSPQVRTALTTLQVWKGPLLLVQTCELQNIQQFYKNSFPTIIQSKDYASDTLHSIASVIFGTDSRSLPQSGGMANLLPTSWQVEKWDESRDMENLYSLWMQSVDPPFTLHITTLAALLHRPGYASHYIVRDSGNQLLGFCATFLSYADQTDENLTASLAVLLVKLEYQARGIGLSLYNYAVDQMSRIRGVNRLQLGSTFPRIFYGLPLYMGFDQAWFLKRGWRLRSEHRGQGRRVYDMLLDFSAWNYNIPNGDLEFRECTKNDKPRVLKIVEAQIAHGCKMGWFDQYAKLFSDVNLKDVVVVVKQSSIVGVALTYTPSCCSPISLDLPWAGQIGDDVGGVTCICIPNVLTVPLLNACIRKLEAQGMRKLFLDAVTNVAELKSLGFREWAAYREIWREL